MGSGPRRTRRRLQFFDGGGNNGYQDQKRYKPQFYTSLSYFKDGWKGSHDFKFGYDWKRDRRNFFNDQPFDIFYRDNNGALTQVDIYNTPRRRINDVVYNAGVDQRHLEGQRSPDAQPRAALRDTTGTAGRSRSSRRTAIPQLANWLDRPDLAQRYFVSSRRSTVGARHGGQHQRRCRRASASPTT